MFFFGVDAVQFTDFELKVSQGQRRFLGKGGK